MTTHVTVDNDGHYTVEVYAVDTYPSKDKDGGRQEILLATLKPGEKTTQHQVYLHSSRHIEVRECQPMRKD